MKIKLSQKPTTESVWNDYHKMIMGIAHKISKQFFKPYDELLSEGIFRVFEKLPKFDPKRSSLCTYVNRCATFGMLDYCIKPPKEIPHDSHNAWGEPNKVFDIETKPSWVKGFLAEVSEETRHLIRVFFEAPEELYEAVRPNQPKTAQKALRTYMIDALDWSQDKVEQAFREISHCL